MVFVSYLHKFLCNYNLDQKMRASLANLRAKWLQGGPTEFFTQETFILFDRVFFNYDIYQKILNTSISGVKSSGQPCRFAREYL